MMVVNNANWMNAYILWIANFAGITLFEGARG